MRLFKKVLVANRGEIAIRIMRTCHEMGMATIAIYSSADRDALHVRCADEAAWVGEAPSTDSYLQGGRIIEVALELEADAIHPGYGFLAENADFAAQCEAAGVVFIGPSAASIATMGSKIEAKKLMRAHDVPVIPGYDGEEQSLEGLKQALLELGFPVLIKASAGGGGKGMRIVRADSEVDEALEAAKREAASAFGDETLLLEKYIDRPRHVEFQILGDQHGTLLHLFERECSIQRRHQKIVEESPSMALTPALRARMAEAAVRAGKAIGYHNAGTVEFILAPDGAFYFLEVNTRLQVEHPVTEGITGLDLVRLQLEVAQGMPLPLDQDSVVSEGHAVEVRIYAEDPNNGFLPATGVLHDWHIPSMPGLRVDSGVDCGSEVGIHYDPMLAKIIATGPTREEATRKLARALRSLSVQGVVTNRDLLIRILEHPRYLEGAIHTHFIDEELALEPRQEEADPDRDRLSALAALMHAHLTAQAKNAVLPGIPVGWRNNRHRDARRCFRVGEDTWELSYRALAPGLYRVVTGFAFMEVRVMDFGLDTVRLEVNGVQRTFRVTVDGDHLFVHSVLGSVLVEALARFPEHEAEVVPGAALAPMPGKVLKVWVREGQEVRAGDRLVTLEAMKMEHGLTAPLDGTVAQVFVQEGALVEAGARLVHVAVASGESETATQT